MVLQAISVKFFGTAKPSKSPYEASGLCCAGGKI